MMHDSPGFQTALYIRKSVRGFLKRSRMQRMCELVASDRVENNKRPNCEGSVHRSHLSKQEWISEDGTERRYVGARCGNLRVHPFKRLYTHSVTQILKICSTILTRKSHPFANLKTYTDAKTSSAVCRNLVKVMLKFFVLMVEMSFLVQKNCQNAGFLDISGENS